MSKSIAEEVLGLLGTETLSTTELAKRLRHSRIRVSQALKKLEDSGEVSRVSLDPIKFHVKQSSVLKQPNSGPMVPKPVSGIERDDDLDD